MSHHVADCSSCLLVSEMTSFGLRRYAKLNPELRNQIYHFAAEAEFESDGRVPPVITKARQEPTAATAYNPGARTFIGLTQSCKQIRTEYRVLWLRDSSIRIKLENVQSYMSTFYPKAEDYSNAPKLLLISWDHENDGYDEEVLFDITLLLRIRAFCPSNVIQFVCRRLVEFDLPYVDCFECGHNIRCNCHTECDHEDTIEEVMFDVHVDYHYMMVLNELLANSNGAWLKALRDDARTHHMKIQCTADTEDQHLTVYLHFCAGRAPAVITKRAMHKGAIRYLQSMGLLGMHTSKAVDFVVGEATGKFTRHSQGCRVAVPTYNQIEIAGTTKMPSDHVGDRSSTP